MEAKAITEIAKFREGTNKDWTKKRTSIPGVFIVYMPLPKGQPDAERALGIEFNPTVDGLPTKRRGIYLRSEDMAQLKEAAKNPKLLELIQHVESINPSVPKGNVGKAVEL